MRAVTWQGTRKMSVETVPDPEIVQQSDVVVKVTATDRPAVYVLT